jgi:hypothetical protein
MVVESALRVMITVTLKIYPMARHYENVVFNSVKSNFEVFEYIFEIDSFVESQGSGS